MFITLCYVYLWVRFRASYAVLIRRTVQQLHTTRCLAFCTELTPGRRRRQPLKQPEENIFLRLGTKVFLIDEPQSLADFATWKLLIGSPFVCSEYDLRAEQIVFLTESALLQTEDLPTLSDSSKKIKWSDYCLPVAYNPGDPGEFIAEATVDNFTILGIAFMENRLQMDNGMLPLTMVSLHLQDPPSQELVSSAECINVQSTCIDSKGATVKHGPEFKQEANMHNLSEQGVNPQKINDDQSEEEYVDLEAEASGRGDHRHLHLSSCHECLELESCTIESVKYASAENIPDLPDDSSGFQENFDECSQTKETKRTILNGKPPNVLLYLGPNQNSTNNRFQEVKSGLMECIDTESYVIYPLKDNQVLKTPWIDNTFLLVIYTDDCISQDVYKQFMSYLEKGGKILGLSSSFSLEGTKVKSKTELKDSVQTLVFRKADCTEMSLNVLISGNVFETVACGIGNNLETLAYINNSLEDSMIIRQSYGDNSGEAILCQVQLEVSPNSLAVKSAEDFNCLKLSNARRYEVLTHILTSLGLRCEQSKPPALTPLYLLTTADGVRASFLQWLGKKVSSHGLMKSSTISLKVVQLYQSDLAISPTLVPLVTEAGDFSSEHFNLEVYRQNLHTKKLGQIVLFAEVASTTMNLLDGLLFDLPQEMGLIAIAARQSQGKGRGGNAWLSPKGCAMFTLHISILLHSHLGQRIAFIQHLMSLAVVEAVKSIPGYQDIDLRVKWPNDIYYGELMKIGGVLVNSTLMGNTFHVLIGCGFNVANGNPTICINDLIEEHNKKAEIKLNLLDTDYLIARTVTKLEDLIDLFQESGPNGVLPLYYKHWVHSGKQVNLGSEAGPLVWIIGVDDSGFLQVQQEDGDIVTVHPDGNSFDMMKNLIIPKHR